MQIDEYELIKLEFDALMIKHWGIILIKDGECMNSTITEISKTLKSIGTGTIISCAIPYQLTTDHSRPSSSFGRVESFAWGFDYHTEVKKILRPLIDKLEETFNLCPETVHTFVDISPYDDREIGYLSGLGSLGKNHLLIHPELGTRFFIGYIVIKEKNLFNHLPSHQVLYPKYDVRCKVCNKCVSACPTQVCGFGVTDRYACLSALTQTKDEISQSHRGLFKIRLYGCSICQEVCPANSEGDYTPILSSEIPNWVDLFELLKINNKMFKEKYGHMGFAWRSLWVYKRNALLILGNSKSQEVYHQLLGFSELTMDEKLGEYYNWAINSLCVSTADS